MRTQVVVFIAAWLGLFCSQSVAAEPVGKIDSVKLPTVSVSAAVPLLKTGEFKMKVARFAPATVSDDRYIYIIGGQDRSGALLKLIERFDTATGESINFGELKTARLWHRAVVVGSQAYILGGYTSTPRMAASSAYSPRPVSGQDNIRANADARIREASLPDLPSGDGLKLENSVEILDLATGKVRPGGVMPDLRAEFGCVLVGDRVYVLGGKHLYKGKASITSRVDLLDVKTGTWSEGPHLPYATIADAAVVDGPFVLVAGGYNGSRAFDTLVALNPRTNEWTNLPTLPKASSAHTSVFLDRYFFLFGNYEAPGEIIAYDLKAKTSSVFTLQYVPARHAGAVRVAEKIYVAGGKPSADAEPLDLIQRFELTKNLPRERR